MNSRNRVPDEIYTLSYGDIVGEHDSLLKKEDDDETAKFFLSLGPSLSDHERKGPFVIANVYSEDGKYFVVKGGFSKVRKFCSSARGVPFAGQYLFVKSVIFYGDGSKRMSCDIDRNVPTAKTKRREFYIRDESYAQSINRGYGFFVKGQRNFVQNSQLKRIVKMADRKVHFIFHEVGTKTEIIGVYRHVPDCFPKELKTALSKG